MPGGDAAILCGGLGTRLRGTLGGLPKSMAPLAGAPLLERLVRWAAEAGVARVWLCTGHGGAAIRAHFAVPAWQPLVAFSHETEPLGTGGALALLASRLAAPRLLALNGDSFVPGLGLAAVLDYHQNHGAAGTVVVTPTERDDVGTVEFMPDRSITAFREKAGLRGRRWANAGVYVLERPLLEAIPAGRAVSLERELLPAWLARGLMAFPFEGEVVDIGTPERLRAARGREPA